MEDENQAAPSAEASASEPLTFESALATLNAQDQAPVQSEPAATETAEAAPEVEEAEQAEAPETTQEEKAAPEADPDAPEYLHGNARTRLRDGSEVTIGELKKAYDEAKEYRVKQAEFDAKRQEFESKQAQIAAQEQLFTNTINQAKAVLQQNFPPKPDYAALERGEIDIITYNEQKARWDHAAEKWHALDRAQKQQAHEAESKRTEEAKKYLAREMDLLKEKMPEARSPESWKAFRDELIPIAEREYGLSAKEVGDFADHRAMLVLRDAMAYRKLQAEKPKALEKAKDAPPVQVPTPGRRVSLAEKQAQTVKSGFDRLRTSGRMEDALAILNDLD